MCVYEEVCVVSDYNVKKEKAAAEEKRKREREKREEYCEYFSKCGRREIDKRV